MRWKIGFILFLFAVSVSAQEHQHGDQHSMEEVGDVNFPISCKPETQAAFNHAVALLHDFWYAESEKAFAKITESDPDCAMPYWGIAMSNYHPVWAAPPSETEIKNAQIALSKVQSIKPATEREAGYIRAISIFYKDIDKLDRLTRAKLHAQEMEKVHAQNPNDLEASVFYALALLGTADITDKTYTVQKQAADILTPLVEKAPHHPGIAHYIIHSFDYPPLAQFALPAARSYAKIAPASPHALHMPSHIFTRLGLWEESIQSNTASAEKAKVHVQSLMPNSNTGAFDQLHAMDYLVYAYLQLGQEEKARQVIEESHHFQKLDKNVFQAAYSFAAMPARIAIEGHHWKEAAALRMEPSWFPWEKFPYTEAITRYAIGIGAARTGDFTNANKQIQRLNELQGMLKPQESYWLKQIEIQKKTVDAWILFGQDKKQEALSMMKAAAELEDSTEKDPVTPGAIMPAHEFVAEMLLETNDVTQAQAEFDKSLAKAPNRRHPAIHKSALAKN